MTDQNQSQEAAAKIQACPLSHGQRALWFMYSMNPSDGAYNMTYIWHVRSALDTMVFRRVLAKLTARHPTMRSTYSFHDGDPMQMVHDHMEVRFDEIAAEGWDDQQLDEALWEERYRPFDLNIDPPIRWRLYRRDDAPVLVLGLHHMGTDVWSCMTMLNELRDLYTAEMKGETIQLPELKMSNTDFVKWQIDTLAGEEGARQLSFWKEQLAGELPDLNLQTDFPRPPVPGVRGGLCTFEIPDSLSADFQRLAKSNGASPFMLCLSAYHVLLKRYTGQNDVCVGVPTAGRDERFSGIFNYFVSPVVVRAKVEGNPPFSEFLKTNGANISQILKHQDYPFPMLVNQVLETRDSSRSPIFQTQFVWENSNRFENRDDPMVTMSENGNELWTLGDLVLERKLVNLTMDHFDLTMKMVKVGEHFYGLIEYNSDLFSAESMDRLAGNFRRLLEGIVADIHCPVGELPILTDEERHLLLVEWNKTDFDYPRDCIVPDLFEAQVTRTPDDIALVFNDERLTYRELNERANKVANFLQSRGVGPDVLVGVCMKRSVEMVVSMFGVLKSGGAYVPADPSYPEDRVAYMLEDAKAPMLLTQENLTEKFSPPGVDVICIDRDWETIAGSSSENPTRTTKREHLSHVIYTSGSTGKPKGVAIEHRNVVALIYWAREFYSDEELSGVLGSTSVCFDLSVYELFFPTSFGGKVILVENALHLMSLKGAEEVILINTVPSVMTELLNAEAVPKSVTTVNLAGEPLPNKLVQRIYQLGTVDKVWDLYGPSEDTTYSTYCLMGRGDDYHVTVGRPLYNTQAYILDQNLQMVPLGVPGELYLGGEGLSRGYLGKPEMTRERFIPNPFSEDPEDRIYKTGDLTKYLADGRIDYMGRIDNQVKIRGFRIELGEIEKVMEKHEDVKDAVVLAREDTPGEKRLVGYLVPSADRVPDIDQLTAHIRESLAEYMVPSAFVVLDAFPLTPNKKIDRKALPKPRVERPRPTAGEGDGPHNEVERMIAEIWKEVLGVDHCSVHDSFFDLGGHSLLMAKVYGKLPKEWKTELSLVDLIQCPTIHKLALRLDNEADESTFFTERDNHLEELKKARERIKSLGGLHIAVIGMAGRFPGADSVDELWDNLINGVEGITFYDDEELLHAEIDPDLLGDPAYVKAQSVLKDVKGFDARFFGLTPREAQITDPQHRIFLECAWEAMENAGYQPDSGRGVVGVYGGVGANNYMRYNIAPNPSVLKTVGEYMIMIGNEKDFLSSRVSYKLNFTGPSIVTQGACFTTLLTIHLACQGLKNGDCNMALAGGVSLALLNKTGYLFQEGMIFSPDGHCRTFDKMAKGTIQGQGCGMVLLKRLEDAVADGDHIYAVVRGTGISNDGSDKIGYTAPSVKGQTQAIMAAQLTAEVDPSTIGYIEAHGTATPLGDPIEMTGLHKIWKDVKDVHSVAIGSIKTNIGHLDTAAGVAGFIKTSLCLDRKKLVPTLHYTEPNPEIDFSTSPFYVNTEYKDWPAREGHPRRAGISSFGIGGTNAHVVLEEAPYRPPSENHRPWRVLTLSAQTESALTTMRHNLINHLNTHPQLGISDVTYTLQVGRTDFKHRLMLVCQSLHDATMELGKESSSRVRVFAREPEHRKVAFMFPGQGAQYLHMGQQLYHVEVTFREEVDRCWGIIKERLPELYNSLSERDRGGTTEKLHETYVTQPATFIVEYALAKLLMEWGIKPDAMFSNSLGEYTAACLSGVFSLEDALTIVAIRGRLMNECEPGEMLAVFLSKEQIQPYLSKNISLAAEVTQEQCMVAGDKSAIHNLRVTLDEKGVKSVRLFSSYAFHSHMMDGIMAKFEKEIAAFKMNKPKIPFISSITGTWITDEEATSPNYWARQFREPVEFSKGLSTLYEDPNRILLEVGPRKTLSVPALRHAKKTRDHIILTTMRDPSEDKVSDVQYLLTTVGRLWLAGVGVDWEAFHREKQRLRVPLPTYPFERKPHWIDPPPKQVLDDRPEKFREERPFVILTLTARSSSSIEYATNHFVRLMQRHPELNLSDMAHTLHRSRQDFRHRRFLVAGSLDEAIKEFEKRDPNRVHTNTCRSGVRPITFMFSGQGSQYMGMCSELYETEPYFRERVDECWSLLSESCPDFYKALTPEDRAFQTEKLNQTFLTQPALFIVEYCLARLLMHWSIRPQTMIGHSIGEYVAACLTGVFSLENALELVVTRGRLMQSMPPGDMLSISKPEADVLPYLNDQVSLAVLNSPKNCVVAGSKDAIDALMVQLKADGVASTRLVTSHAFHSHMMEPILEEFTQKVARFNPNPPRTPFISNVTGSWITEEDATDPAYWARHLRQAVRFSQGLQVLLREPERILVEIGPGTVLSTLAKRNPKKENSHTVISTTRHVKDKDSSDSFILLSTIGQLWLEGVSMDWERFNLIKGRHGEEFFNFYGSMPVGLPTEPEIEPDELETDPETEELNYRPNVNTGYAAPSDSLEETIAGIWREFLGLDKVGVNDDFYALGGDSLVAVQIMPGIGKLVNISLSPSILASKKTISALAEFIREHQADPGAAMSPIIRIQESKSGNPPLYMVHPIGGEVFFYMDLPRHLGAEWPLYAFQAPSLLGAGEPFTDIPKQASYYVEELLKTKPKEPILLGGSSYGGIVAYEMGRQLIAKGLRVELCVIIDAPAPGAMPAELTDSAAIIEYLLEGKIPLDVDELRGLTVSEQLEYVKVQAEKANNTSVLDTLTPDMFRTWLGHQEGMMKYQPQDTNIPVIYFRHTERMAYFPKDPHKPWMEWAKSGIEIHQTPGNHITMNFDPNVKELAKHLKKKLKGSI